MPTVCCTHISRAPRFFARNAFVLFLAGADSLRIRPRSLRVKDWGGRVSHRVVDQRHFSAVDNPSSRSSLAVVSV